jgi:choice-of-anchor C domain-containing protein
MRLRRILTAGITAALVLPAVTASAATPSGPIFQDGFESPVVAGQFQQFPTGARIGPWTVTSGNVDLATTRLWQSPEGRQNLDLDGNANGAVSTTIATRPLTTYRVTFKLAGNPAAGPLIKSGEVRANGRTVQRFTFDTHLTSLSRMGFTTSTVFVFSLSDKLTLQFASTTQPAGWGPVIDDVRVDSCLVILCPKTKAARA